MQLRSVVGWAASAAAALLLAGCGGGGPSPSPQGNGFNLPFNDINVLITTDTHSWIAGHKHEPQYDVTYGDVLSFYKRMKEDCDANGRDLFFVMNGDINDGTGISTDPPAELVPLLQQMPWDAVTVGNHELYENTFIEYISKPEGFVEFWGDAYLTANVVNSATNKTLGRRYKFLRGAHGTRLLALGFLYNMSDHDSAVRVLHAEQVVKEAWFQSVIGGNEGEFDAVLVLAHMHYVDPYVNVILDAIRDLQPDVPVQFVTGHSHKRLYTALDRLSSSFEAGNYLNTVGFASFPNSSSAKLLNRSGKAEGFSHVFIDASMKNFTTIANMTDISTPEGDSLKKAIQDARERLGLTTTLGCAPTTYDQYAPLNESNALWGVVLDKLIKETLFSGNMSGKVYMQSIMSARYNLYEGNVTMDDIMTMMPFADEFWLVAKDVPGHAIEKALDNLNAGSPYALKPFVSTAFEPDDLYELYSASYDVGTAEKPGKLLQEIMGLLSAPSMTPKHRFVGQNSTSLWRDFVTSQWPCEAHTLLV